MKIETINKIVTGNYYIDKDGKMHVEIKRASTPSRYSIPMVTFKYISEDRIDH